jgi:hypothetical protein
MMEVSSNESLKKKRGRRKKQNEVIVESVSNENIHVTLEEEEEEEEHNNETKNIENSTNEPILKKRGRKPKGGKLTFKQPEKVEEKNSIANIILHLKCSMSDLTDYNNKINKLMKNPLEYDPSVPPNLLTYNQDDAIQFSEYKNDFEMNEKKESNNNISDYAYNEKMSVSNISNIKYVCSICNSVNTDTNSKEKNVTEGDNDTDDDIDVKNINLKLKKLKINLYKNQNQDKKSACFWCTYSYDNPSCYIPKYEMDEKIYGYGSFCRPECAVAYLMKENIDDSTKFERYHLLNQIYSKVYDFKKSIKPAPNPYYLLDKFYGNLSIQEYRKLLKTEHMLLVIEKPLTRILPELHEDNEDLIVNIYGGNKTSSVNNNSNNTGVYKVKRQSEKQQGPSKSSIMKDKFGIS